MSFTAALSNASYSHNDKKWIKTKAGVRKFIKGQFNKAYRKNAKQLAQQELEDTLYGINPATSEELYQQELEDIQAFHDAHNDFMDDYYDYDDYDYDYNCEPIEDDYWSPLTSKKAAWEAWEEMCATSDDYFDYDYEVQVEEELTEAFKGTWKAALKPQESHSEPLKLPTLAEWHNRKKVA